MTDPIRIIDGSPFRSRYEGLVFPVHPGGRRSDSIPPQVSQLLCERMLSELSASGVTYPVQFAGKSVCFFQTGHGWPLHLNRAIDLLDEDGAQSIGVTVDRLFPTGQVRQALAQHGRRDRCAIAIFRVPRKQTRARTHAAIVDSVRKGSPHG